MKKNMNTLLKKLIELRQQVIICNDYLSKAKDTITILEQNKEVFNEEIYFKKFLEDILTNCITKLKNIELGERVIEEKKRLQRPLSPKEEEVFTMLLKNCTLIEMSTQMGVSKSRIRHIVAQIGFKLGLEEYSLTSIKKRLL